MRGSINVLPVYVLTGLDSTKHENVWIYVLKLLVNVETSHTVILLPTVRVFFKTFHNSGKEHPTVGRSYKNN